jgi:hypothetical protein
MTKVTWTQIKQSIISNNSDYSWLQDDNSYTVTTFGGSQELTAIIPITVPASSDQTDFETNYKNSSSIPRSSLFPKPFIDNSVATTFTGAGQTLVIDTTGCSTVQYGTINHSWIGDISTELSYDNGANWFPCATADTDPSTNLLMLEWGGAFSSAFNDDPWEVNSSGSTNFRLRVLDYTSGSLDVTMISSAASTDVATPSNDRWNVGTASALNGTITGATAGCSSCGIAVSGTWSGVLTFQASIDNVNFFNISVIDLSTGFQIPTVSANGNYMTPCGGYNLIRALVTSYSSGSIVVTFDAGTGSQEGLYPIDPPTKYNHITGNATTTVKSGVGRLHSICINNNTTGGLIKVYDNTAGSGTLIMTLTIGTPSGGLLSSSGQGGPIFMGPLGVNGLTFTTGLTVVTSGSTSNDITVIYQ